MRAKWADFLFTLAVRFIVGAVLGALASILICAPVGRKYSQHMGTNQLLLWVTGDAAHPHRFLYWVLAWSLGGAIIAMFTIPYWQTPWYKRERLKFDQRKEGAKKNDDVPK